MEKHGARPVLYSSAYVYKQTYDLNILLPDIIHRSVAKQMRFFADLECVPQAFTAWFSSRGQHTHTPGQVVSDMKSFVHDMLQNQRQGFFSIASSEW